MAESAKVGSSVLVGVIMFIAASAWVANEVFSTSPYMNDSAVPAYAAERSVSVSRSAPTTTTSAPTTEEMVPASESLLAEEAVVIARPPAPEPVIGLEPVTKPRPVIKRHAPAPQRAVRAKAPPRVEKRNLVRTAAPAQSTPAPERVLYSKAVIVEERRPSLDQRIEMDVMERLASDPRLAGRIGVQSSDAVVLLTGWTPTVGQARRAEREARSVRNVRYVRNEIRPRVGGPA